jgi:hypothetical protein
MAASFQTTVPNARSAQIGDRELATLRRIAHDARHELAGQAEAEWLISACGPLLDELAQRRAAMAELPLQIDLSNVVILDAVR